MPRVKPLYGKHVQETRTRLGDVLSSTDVVHAFKRPLVFQLQYLLSGML